MPERIDDADEASRRIQFASLLMTTVFVELFYRNDFPCAFVRQAREGWAIGSFSSTGMRSVP